MATPSRRTKPKTPQERMRARRERLRAQGLRPVQHWVPDLRDPGYAPTCGDKESCSVLIRKMPRSIAGSKKFIIGTMRVESRRYRDHCPR
jgi:hypothetical protein